MRRRSVASENAREGVREDRLGKTMFSKIGGQAVIEGVMMRAPGSVATAVRRPDGTIAVRHRPFRSVTERFRFLKLPIFRGAVVLIESLALGMGALMYSAEEASEEESKGKEKKKEKEGDPGEEVGEMEETKEMKEKKGGGGSSLALWGTLALSLVLGIGFFFYLPLKFDKLDNNRK